MKDVAVEAGVSVGTVSNVLNQPERVASATLERVNDAIALLGFVRNEAARQLRVGRSTSIGLLVPDASNPFFAELARGVDSRAAADGLIVFGTNSDDDLERQHRTLDVFEQQRMTGVVVSPVSQDLEHIARLSRNGTPVVMIERDGRPVGLSSVAVDNLRGGRLAVDHLAAMGRKRITFIGGPMSMQQVVDRHAGAGGAAQTAGAGFETILSPALTVAAGRAAAAEMLETPRNRWPDGVFAANDLLAIGVVQELRARNVDVPGDIAVVGYDDIDFAASIEIPLTSIRQPSRRLGEVAADLLISRASDPDTPLTHQVFDPEIVVRASTRRANP